MSERGKDEMNQDDLDIGVEVEIEEIMREIRLEILSTQDVFQGVPGLSRAFMGSRFDPDMYDHLYQAALYSNVSGVTMYLTPSRVPVFGLLWQYLRHLLHRLALFYIEAIANKQSQINQQLLTAVVELVNDLETEMMNSNQLSEV